MRINWFAISIVLFTFVLSECASESNTYKLPSSHNTQKPEWVATHKSTRDTIFVVIHTPRNSGEDLSSYIQSAQSELHNILSSEIEIVMRDYWEQKQIDLSEDEKFERLSSLPRTLEQIMNHVTVSDGWNNTEDASFLCALDYEEVTHILMNNMGIEDQAFLAYFKRCMDEMAQEYR